MKNIFKKIVDKNNKQIFLICEISGNHLNSFHYAKKLILETIKQKVDLVKFQVYRPDTLTIDCDAKDFKIKNNNWSKHKSLFKLFEKSHTPWIWIVKLTKILNAKKINWFASAFDETSVDFLEKLKCKAYKIASPEITDTNLIEYIAKKNKPIIFSTGMSEKKDIDLAIKIVKKYHKKYALLKCVSEYPADYSDLNLSSISTLKKKYNCAVGFSDHTVDELASITSVMYGAQIVEKHFKLDKDMVSIDSHFSTPISNYGKIKKNLNSVHKCIGKKNNIFNLSLANKQSRRSLYINCDVKKDETITFENIKSVRPGYGLHPKYLKNIVGKKFKKNLTKGRPLRFKDIY